MDESVVFWLFPDNGSAVIFCDALSSALIISLHFPFICVLRSSSTATFIFADLDYRLIRSTHPPPHRNYYELERCWQEVSLVRTTRGRVALLRPRHRRNAACRHLWRPSARRPDPIRRRTR
jgi:hypothetical protein